MKILQQPIKHLFGSVAIAFSAAASSTDLTLPPPNPITPPSHFYPSTVIRDPVGLITRRLSVLSFLHPDGGYVEGEEWDNRYYHIKTPVKRGGQEMWRYDLKGYSYGIGKPLDFTWVGYFCGDATGCDWDVIINGSCSDTAGNNIPCSQYKGKDGFLYLKFGPIRQYFNSFTLDYQSGSTGARTVHKLNKPNSYRVMLTKDEAENF
jgi:hypothetical protein